MFGILMVVIVQWQFNIVVQFEMCVFVIYVVCQQVYCWIVDKICYKQVGGFFVDFNWCVNLFGNVVVYYYYLLGECYCFNLIVSNVE